MRLLPSDPDVATIVARIKNHDINLQPEFQRGEVWSTAKKQKLIDSILRDWHVPPIHVIEVKGTAQQEVLDGQQRLVSIRDFVNGEFTVDGHTEPYNEGLAGLDGLRYSSLPTDWRRRFDRFTVRIFLITDYESSEPGELFFRLNQPMSLTAAEQRNAFFGPARQQVKVLVAFMDQVGIDKSFLGFSNSRMAYDDVLARLCCSLEAGTLNEKVTAAMLAGRYRSDTPFGEDILHQAEASLSLLAQSKSDIRTAVRFNKATLFSWLWFINEARNQFLVGATSEWLGSFITFFESSRKHFLSPERDEKTWVDYKANLPPAFLAQLIYVYNDRSSARVADVASVVFRDVVTWVLFEIFLTSRPDLGVVDDYRLRWIEDHLANQQSNLKELSAETFIEGLLRKHKWGRE